MTLPQSLAELELGALERVDEVARAKLAGGYNDEQTYRRTTITSDGVGLWPRRFAAHAELSLGTSLLGTPVSLPVLPAPATPHAMVHDDAELAVTRAAVAAGTLPVVPCFGSTGFDVNAEAADGAPIWAQCFFLKDRAAMVDQMQELEGLGYQAALFTVDSPTTWLRREQEAHLPTASTASAGYQKMLTIARGVDWDYFTWLRGETSVELVLKGVLRGDMARRGLDCGAAGVVVSAHGARLFDGQLASIDALAEVAQEVGDDGLVLYDGGVRSGAQVLHALSLGARAVLLGRPIFHGLAFDGSAGVSRVFDILREEIRTALRLIGASSIHDVSADDFTAWLG